MSASPTHARRPAGTPSGGQFAPEAHAEPEVSLAPAVPESTPETNDYGTTRWWGPEGRLHRTDGPAVERPDGAVEWWVHGKRHRTGAPAVVQADGTTEWWQAGLLHREDGPAIEYPDGVKLWYRHGRLHREDGPAVERPDGSVAWYVDGQELEAPPEAGRAAS